MDSLAWWGFGKAAAMRFQGGNQEVRREFSRSTPAAAISESPAPHERLQNSFTATTTHLLGVSPAGCKAFVVTSASTIFATIPPQRAAARQQATRAPTTIFYSQVAEASTWALLLGWAWANSVTTATPEGGNSSPRRDFLWWRDSNMGDPR